MTVTESLQSRAKDFAKVSENDTNAISESCFFYIKHSSTLITHRKLVENI